METEHSSKYKANYFFLRPGMLLWVLIVVSSCGFNAEKLPQASKGILDADMIWESKPEIYSLNGEWEFYPNQFIEPGHFSSDREPMFVQLPGYWSGSQYRKYPDKIQYGTYRLFLVNHGLPAGYSLRNNHVASTFALFINGREILTLGHPATNLQDEVPCSRPLVTDVDIEADTLEFVLHVSSHNIKDGGVFQAFQLGPERDVVADFWKRTGIDGFLAGALLIMAFYYLLLFLVFKKDMSSLYFSLFIFIITFRIIVIGQRSILLLAPGLNWDFLIRAEYATFYAAPALFALYFYSLFPKNSKLWLVNTAAITSIAFTLIVLILPVRVFSHTLTLYQGFVIAMGIVILYWALRAYRVKAEGAGMFLFGAAMIFIAMTHDILQVVANISGQEIFPAGLLVFVLSQSYVLSLKLSGLNKKNEELYKQLDYSNKNLEMIVDTRTRELIQQKNLLMETNEALEQQKEDTQAQSEMLEEINETLEKEKEKSDQLLLNVLPKNIADELKLYGKSLAHSYPMVSVLFIDFVKFSEFSEKMDPSRLLKDLHFYFANFDDVNKKYNLEKIKTIGDAYMCAGGLRESADERDVVSTVGAALEISQFLRSNLEDRLSIGEQALECRIGIHTGPVIAGVVGKSKFAFDIWGPTVNIAKRMETACEPGKVNVSEDTWKYVKDFFTYTSRGEISMKHKKNMQMFYIDGIKKDPAK